MKSRYQIFLLCLFWCFVFGCVYFTGKHNTEKPKKSAKDQHKFIEHLKDWCAEVEYFDTVSHTLKYYYSPVKENYHFDGIIAFNSINGTLIDSTLFLNDGRFSINGEGSISDITLKDGKHYKITMLQFGKCGSITHLDSLKKDFVDEPEQSDDPPSDDN